MRIIVGIGNPGKKYVDTRHNIGFQILDEFCKKENLSFQPTKSDFWIMESILDTFHFFLQKPTTYVNNSGLAVKELIEKLEIEPSDILVIYDDINLDVGNIRIRKSGGDGGHNGIKSIIYHLENNKFTRLRIGIGSKGENQELADYVLSKFQQKEIKEIENNIPFIIDLMKQFIEGGSTQMLNYYSTVKKDNSSNIAN